LIEKGAYIDAQDNYDHTPLHQALKNEQYEVADFLIGKGADILRSKTNIKKNILNSACKNNYSNIVTTLLRQGADVNTTQNKIRKSLLHTAAIFNRSHIIKILAAYNANINIQDRIGETPLHKACRNGSYDAVVMLINKGAHADIKNKLNGCTPLFLAVLGGHVHIADLLIEKGAVITTQSNQNNTLLDMAIMNNRFEMIDFLLDKGVNINTQKNKKYIETLVHSALQSNRDDIATSFINKGYRLYVKDHNGQTPLHIAISAEKVNIAHLLVSKGSHLSIQDNDGNTPLHIALKRYLTNIITLLVTQGADINALNKKGVTALYIILLSGDEKIIDLIIDNGGLIDPKILLSNESYEVYDVIRFAHEISVVEMGYLPARKHFLIIKSIEVIKNILTYTSAHCNEMKTIIEKIEERLNAVQPQSYTYQDKVMLKIKDMLDTYKLLITYISQNKKLDDIMKKVRNRVNIQHNISLDDAMLICEENAESSRKFTQTRLLNKDDLYNFISEKCKTLKRYDCITDSFGKNKRFYCQSLEKIQP
jgi:ankyrin repeat protein